MLTKEEREKLATAKVEFETTGQDAFAEYQELFLRIASFPGYDKREAYQVVEGILFNG